MTTCLIKVTQGEKAFTLAHSLRLPSFPMGKAGQQKHEAAVDAVGTWGDEY